MCASLFVNLTVYKYIFLVLKFCLLKNSLGRCNLAMSDNSWLCSHVIRLYPFPCVARLCCLRCSFHRAGENLRIFKEIKIMPKSVMVEIQHQGAEIDSEMLVF